MRLMELNDSLHIRAVVDAMNDFKNKKGEEQRFELLVKNFASSVHMDLKVCLSCFCLIVCEISYMTFINALINIPSDLDMRVSIRNEFLRLGLKEIVDNFKKKCDLTTDIELLTQIDVFEEESALDYKDIHDRFSLLDVDMKYP